MAVSLSSSSDRRRDEDASHHPLIDDAPSSLRSGATAGVASDVTTAEELEHVSDRAFLTGWFHKRQMMLHLVAISSTVALLDHVARLREVRDHAERGALGDPDGRGDVAEADTRVARDAQQDSSVVRQEAPLRHPSDSSLQQPEMTYMNAGAVATAGCPRVRRPTQAVS